MFNSNNIQVINSVSNWEEAIEVAAQPLINNGNIKESYVDAMISSIKKMGFYVVIDDHLAMPHARPEDGVVKGGISFLKVNDGVDFGGSEVSLIFVLAADNNNNHIERLEKLMTIFQNNEVMSQLKSEKSIDKIIEILGGI